MDRSPFAAAVAPVETQERDAQQPQAAADKPVAPNAPQVLDERMLAQVVGGLPRVGGW